MSAVGLVLVAVAFAVVSKVVAFPAPALNEARTTSMLRVLLFGTLTLKAPIAGLRMYQISTVASTGEVLLPALVIAVPFQVGAPPVLEVIPLYSRIATRTVAPLVGVRAKVVGFAVPRTDWFFTSNVWAIGRYT
jgi:hypothetical protein